MMNWSIVSTAFVVVCGVLSLTLCQLYDCETVIDKNLAWFSINNVTNPDSNVYTGVTEVYSNSSIVVYDSNHNLQTYGTYELAASPNGTHCYMIATLNINNTSTNTNTKTKTKNKANVKGGYQQCSTFSITKDLKSLVSCTVAGYWCDEYCNPAMTYYTSWTTAWIANSLNVNLNDHTDNNN